MGGCSAAACQCLLPNNANLVLNGGFDTNVEGWAAGGSSSVSRSDKDAAECGSSGSLLVKNTAGDRDSQFDTDYCVRVTPDTQYNFGARLFAFTSGSTTFAALMWAESQDCQAVGSRLMFEKSLYASRVNEWTAISASYTAPPWANSLKVQISAHHATSEQFMVDMVYVTPAPGAF